MGCDIHPVVQRRVNGVWEYVPLEKKEDDPWDHPLEARNYNLFAVLAGVRNRSGLTPISEPRGLPDDFGPVDIYGEEFIVEPHDTEARNHPWDCDKCVSLGDHSQSWVTLRELIEYPWHVGITEYMTVSIQSYWSWTDKTDYPSQYSRGVSGRRVLSFKEEHLPPKDTLDALIADGYSVYVEVAYVYEARNAVGDSFCKTVMSWLQTLGSPDDVRIVFGFDS